MTRPESPLLGGTWFRTEPTWGAGTSVGVGPGLQGPDYGAPRAPQPGEGPALLPAPGGEDPQKAADARALTQPPVPRYQDYRLDPFYSVAGPVQYSTAGGAINLINLGKPSAGWRWIVRQYMVIPGTTITDTGGAGATVHFYVGQSPPPGVAPQLTDWAYALNIPAATGTFAVISFTSDSQQVQTNQYLLAQVVNGVNGFTYLPGARVKLIRDVGVPHRDVV